MTIKQGETYPPFSATLADAAGMAVDLTGAAVTLRMSDAYGMNVIDDAAMTITDAAAGKVEREWLETETDTPGVFFAEIWVELDGARTPYPNQSYVIVEILPAVAAGGT
jgi:hypothetical protein